MACRRSGPCSSADHRTQTDSYQHWLPYGHTALSMHCESVVYPASVGRFIHHRPYPSQPIRARGVLTSLALTALEAPAYTSAHSRHLQSPSPSPMRDPCRTVRCRTGLHVHRRALACAGRRATPIARKRCANLMAANSADVRSARCNYRGPERSPGRDHIQYGYHVGAVRTRVGRGEADRIAEVAGRRHHGSGFSTHQGVSTHP